MHRSFAGARIAALATLAALLLSACGEPAGSPAPGPGIDVGELAAGEPADGSGEPADEFAGNRQALLGDGHHLGHVRHIDIDNATILVDLVTWVNDDDEPNGFRIEDDDDTLHAGRLAGDVTAAVIDCTQACEPVAVELAAIAGGSARPLNGPDALFDIVVRDGLVRSVEERYTP